MRKHLFIFLCLLLLGVAAQAQNVTITPSGITPAQGGTYQRLSYDAILALPSPAVGDMAYDLTFRCLRLYNGDKWLCSSQTPGNLPNMIAILSAGGTSSDEGSGIAVDASGNVYITGSYSRTAIFASGSMTAQGSLDVFIAKYNSIGTLQWVRSAGGTSDDRGRGIAVDASGNVYITGYYSGTATFSGVSLTSAGGSDNVYVAKYNSSGALFWVRSAGGTLYDEGSDIAVDASGNVYITGIYSGTATFASGVSLTAEESNDVFVAKYNSSGTLQWVRSAGGTSDDRGNGIAVDVSGNVYITGNYSRTATFAFGVSLTVEGISDVFVAKYNSSGTLQWVRSAGGTNNDYGRGIAVDVLGNVYAMGTYQGTATFASGVSLTAQESNDVYVAKYNSSGTLQWVRSAGGTSDDKGRGIAVDASGNVYITGYYFGTATFASGVSLTAQGSYDVYVAKYNSSGALQWVRSAGGASNDYGYGIAVDVSGNVYATGSYSGTATFGRGTFTSSGSDIFVLRVEN